MTNINVLPATHAELLERLDHPNDETSWSEDVTDAAQVIREQRDAIISLTKAGIKSDERCENLESKLSKLLAVVERVIESSEECTDFDGFTAQLIDLAVFHSVAECYEELKMDNEFTEQVVETLDEAGCIIANKNIEIDTLQDKLALAMSALEKVGELMLCGKKDHLPIRCDKANKVVISTLKKLKEKV